MKFLSNARPPTIKAQAFQAPRFSVSSAQMSAAEGHSKTAKIQHPENDTLANAFLAAALIVPLALNVSAYNVEQNPMVSNPVERRGVFRNFKSRG